MLRVCNSAPLIVETRKKKRKRNDRTATASLQRLEKGGTRYQFRVREERSRPISDDLETNLTRLKEPASCRNISWCTCRAQVELERLLATKVRPGAPTKWEEGRRITATFRRGCEWNIAAPRETKSRSSSEERGWSNSRVTLAFIFPVAYRAAAVCTCARVTVHADEISFVLSTGETNPEKWLPCFRNPPTSIPPWISRPWCVFNGRKFSEYETITGGWQILQMKFQSGWCTPSGIFCFYCSQVLYSYYFSIC